MRGNSKIRSKMIAHIPSGRSDFSPHHSHLPSSLDDVSLVDHHFAAAVISFSHYWKHSAGHKKWPMSLGIKVYGRTDPIRTLRTLGLLLLLLRRGDPLHGFRMLAHRLHHPILVEPSCAPAPRSLHVLSQRSRSPEYFQLRFGQPLTFRPGERVQSLVFVVCDQEIGRRLVNLALVCVPVIPCSTLYLTFGSVRGGCSSMSVVSPTLIK